MSMTYNQDDVAPAVPMTPCPHCDQAAVTDESGCCVHCGADRSGEAR